MTSTQTGRATGAECTAWRTMSAKTVACALLTLALAQPLVRLLPENIALCASLKLVVSTVNIAVLPGMAVVLVLRPLRCPTLLMLFGIGMAVSFGIVQLLTFVSLIGHVPVYATTMALWFSCLGLLHWVLFSESNDNVFSVERGELLIVLLLAILSFFTYFTGFEYTCWTGEDGIHISVIRRLAFLNNPSLDNIYWAPGLIYTYPFPATHYFFAQVSQAGNIEPFYVYGKMRFFWCLGATTFVYLGTRVVFRNPRLAICAGLAAATFALNGVFAQVKNFSWAQLVPLSHASDIAMNVYLPALIVTALCYLRAECRRSLIFFLATTLFLVLLLAVVHIREVVQYLVYFGAYFVALLLFRRDRTALLRSGGLLAASLIVAVGYITWHKHTVGHIDGFVQERRELLIKVASEFSLADWTLRPFVHRHFVCAENAFFFGWIPFVLLATPWAVWVYRDEPLMLFVGASIAAYLAIIRLPFLTIPYIYFTYFEILFTPVRNVAFFVYMLTGVLLYLLASGLARLPRTYYQYCATILAAAALVKLYRSGFNWLWPVYMEPLSLGARADIALVLMLMMFAVLAVALWRSRVRQPESGELLEYRGTMVFFGAMVVALGIFTREVTSSPLATSLRRSRNTPDQLLDLPEVCERNVAFPYNLNDPDTIGEEEGIRIPEVDSIAPSPGLRNWANHTLSANAVLAINVLNRYSPSAFLPQQIACWPHNDVSTPFYFRRILPTYYSFMEKSLRNYQEQPFFNEQETLEERLDFVRELGVTHILVDPMYHNRVGPVLERTPQYFSKVYDDGSWAVYAVQKIRDSGR